jgi:uncharacterized phosphosugar-binding protein
LSVTQQFLERVREYHARIAREEAGRITAAAALIADCVAGGGLVHVVGPGGHSMLAAEECFYRAGGLVPIDAILDGGFWLGAGAARSTRIERTPGYAKAVLDGYALRRGEVLMIVNAYGVNAATIDAAGEGRARGLATIGVTSVEHSRSLPRDHPARHPSGRNLFEIVDVYVDTKVPVGDGVLRLPGLDEPVGPISTLNNAFALNAILLEAMAQLLARGQTPPIWRSANSPGGDEFNRRYFEEYGARIRRLL